MQISEFKTQIPNNPPPGEGWVRRWHGYYTSPRFDTYTHVDLEKFAFLSIISQYAGKHVNMFELGAGRGDWCMALAGVVKLGLIPNAPSSYRALAIEAEPNHFQWATEHIEKQNINAQAVHGAVCNEVGWRNFYVESDPLVHFGQSIKSEGLRVPAFTVEWLMDKYKFDHVHLIHMDVQRSEVEVVQKTPLDKVDNLIIAVHEPHFYPRLTELLSSTHNLVAELKKLGRLELPEVSKPFLGKGDGVQVWSKL